MYYSPLRKAANPPCPLLFLSRIFASFSLLRESISCRRDFFLGRVFDGPGVDIRLWHATRELHEVGRAGSSAANICGSAPVPGVGALVFLVLGNKLALPCTIGML